MEAKKQFIPFHEIEKHKGVIVVDALHPAAFNLSHWRSAPKIPKIADDTSAGIVINAIKSNLPELSYSNISSNHFDVDGFIGIWSLLNPGLAVKNETLLKEMALIGDFRESNKSCLDHDMALKLVCWINFVEKENFYAPFVKNASEESEAKMCVDKFHYFLPYFTNVLENPAPFQHEWDVEYSLVEVHKQIMASSRTKIGVEKKIALYTVSTTNPLHYYALFADTANSEMVLSIYETNKYELEYKYTTWVDTERNGWPRINLQPLADILNGIEKSVYRWDCNPITDTGPLLRLNGKGLRKEERFDHPMNRKFQSSTIGPEILSKIVVQYFEFAYSGLEKKKNWSWMEIREVNRNIDFEKIKTEIKI